MTRRHLADMIEEYIDRLPDPYTYMDMFEVKDLIPKIADVALEMALEDGPPHVTSDIDHFIARIEIETTVEHRFEHAFLFSNNLLQSEALYNLMPLRTTALAFNVLNHFLPKQH